MRFSFRFFLSLLIFTLSGTSSWANEKLVYAGPPNISIPVIVALDQGYFAAEGLDVDYQPLQTGKQAMEAVLSGRADFGSVVTPNVVYAGFQTGALRLIASFGATFEDAILFPADSSIHTPADLRGKRIGLAMSTSSQDVLIHILDKNGIAWSDIIPVSLQPPVLVAALKGKQVDAVMAWQPWRAQIHKALKDEVREIENDVYPRQDFCATNASYVVKHPDVPGKLLRALMKAETYINQNQGAVVTLLARKTEVDEDVARSYVMPHHLTMNGSILSAIQSYATWVVHYQEEFFNKPFSDYRRNIAPEFLRQVDPSRVEKGM